MNPEKLLDITFDCECGRSHEVPVRSIIYSDDAMERLPEVLGPFVNNRSIVIVADKRTWAIAGERAKKILKKTGWSVNNIIIPDIPRKIAAKMDGIDFVFTNKRRWQIPRIIIPIDAMIADIVYSGSTLS